MTNAPERRRTRAARRGNKEGTAPFQRSDGRWCAAVSADNGKRKYLYGKTRREVAEKLAVVLKDAHLGVPLPNERTTTARYLAEWLENTIKPSRRQRTFLRYETAVRLHILPSIGSAPLAKLGPQHVQKLQRDLTEKGLGVDSIMLVRATLSGALMQAAKWGLIVRNPVSLVDPPHAKTYEPQPLTPEQATTLLTSIEGHEFEQLYTVMLATGLRIGEALGLRWADVDLPTARLRVRQQLVEVPGHPRTFSEPKSAHGRRTIPLIPAAVSALHAQRARVLENRLQAADSWQPHELVFPDEVGGALVSRRVERVFKQTLKRVGLPLSYTPHTLRHSAATYLLAAGVPDRVVMEIMGHSSLVMTSHYEHVMSSMLQDAGERLSRVFPGAAVR